MKRYIRLMLAGAAIAAPCAASAQNTSTGYFLDDYAYRFQMNPAYGNSKNFVSLPALGNVNFGINGNLGLSDVIYNVDGKTTTFLNPKLSAQEVLANIHDVNRIGLDTKIVVLAGGFKAFGGYNTVSISERASVGLKIPGAAFSLLKEGVANNSYQIGNLKGFANGYFELSFGHSRALTEEIRVGGNLKVLLGEANAKIDMRRADLDLGADDWRVTTDGDINVNLKGFRYDTDVNENTGHRYVSGADVDGTGIGGFGLAFDLGAVYKPAALPDFEFSLALQDLGFISWSNNMLATTNGVKTFNTDKYTFNVDDDAPNSFKHEWDDIKDDLSALYELEDAGDQGGMTTGLGATVNVGALYALPYYRNLKFGLLNTTRVQGQFTWTDFRLSANVMPCKIFDASVSMHAGTFGMGMGWLANLHCTGFNLFIGMDHAFGKLAKQGVPLRPNGSLNLGLNVLF